MRKNKLLLLLALLMTAATGAWAQWTGGTYTATANENLGAITVNGDATLTINSDVTVTVTGGINVASGTLTVTGPGTLVVTGAKGNDGASGWNGSNGGNGGVAISGNIIVQGGATVTATGGNGGKGGSGELEAGNGGNGGVAFAGTLTYKSGTVTANGGSAGSGGYIEDEEEYASSGSAGKAFANDVDFTQTTGYSVTNGTSTIGSVLNQTKVVISGGTDPSASSGYTVSLKDGVKDAGKWTVKVGEGEAQALPIGGLKGDGSETVTLQYNGRLKVKGVKATSDEAPAAASFTEVTTFSELQAALSAGKNVKLKNDIVCTAEIEITSNVALTIDGNGKKLSTTSEIRAFKVGSSATVAFKDLTLTGFVNGGGPAINNSGTIVLDGCTISNCHVNNTNGGGAIENKGSSSKLYAINTTFSGNYSGEIGGAINNYRGSLYMSGCTFTNNYTTQSDAYYGGAIGINGGDEVRLINCTFSENKYGTTTGTNDIGVFNKPENYTIAGCTGATIASNNGDITTYTTGTATLDYSDLSNISFTVEQAAETGLLSGVFSVSASKKVNFSKGNLRYESSKWSFFDNQYDRYTSYSADAWDHFGWSTSTTTYGMNTSTSYGTYSGDFVDWGATMGAGWFTLSKDEWKYLFNTRSASTVGGTENARYAKAKVNGVQGVILFPDTYTHPDGVTAPTGVNATGNTGWNDNSYTVADWTKMESAGCVFLPAAGYRGGSEMVSPATIGYYWSATPINVLNTYSVYFGSSSLNPVYSNNRNYGCSVRLVQEVAANP